MLPWLIALVAGFAGGVGLHAWYRRRRDRRIAARRVVEAPNSSYVSDLVLRRERHDRWAGIVLAALHPLNRDEVEHLMDIVKARGESGLSERQRTFLDTLAGWSSTSGTQRRHRASP